MMSRRKNRKNNKKKGRIAVLRIIRKVLIMSTVIRKWRSFAILKNTTPVKAFWGPLSYNIRKTKLCLRKKTKYSLLVPPGERSFLNCVAIMHVLKYYKAFKFFSKYYLMSMGAAMSYVVCKSKNDVYEGDVPKSFFFVMEGEMKVTQKVYSKELKRYVDLCVRIIGPGEFFGAYELSALTLMQHSYKKHTKSVKLLSLSPKMFDFFLKPYLTNAWLNEKITLCYCYYIYAKKNQKVNALWSFVVQDDFLQYFQREGHSVSFPMDDARSTQIQCTHDILPLHWEPNYEFILTALQKLHFTGNNEMIEVPSLSYILEETADSLGVSEYDGEYGNDSSQMQHCVLTSPLNDYGFMVSILRTNTDYQVFTIGSVKLANIFEVGKSVTRKLTETEENHENQSAMHVVRWPGQWLQRARNSPILPIWNVNNCTGGVVSSLPQMHFKTRTINENCPCCN